MAPRSVARVVAGTIHLRAPQTNGNDRIVKKAYTNVSRFFEPSAMLA
jgi:hypothetical protein